MKIRNGFVSNSSSSSFIINGKIDEVAKSMLKTVIEEFSEWADKTKISKKDKVLYKTWQTNLKKALKNKDVQDGKIGITMPSCNYETYIIQVGSEVHVSTCNNHAWDLDYIKCGGGADYGDDDIVFKSIDKTNFFDVRNELIHGREKYLLEGVECPNCAKKGDYANGARIECDGKILCANCYKEIKK